MKLTSSLVLIAATAAPSWAIHAQTDSVSLYSQWEHRLRQRVNADLAYPIAANGASGDVLVAFKIGPDGKPTDVSLQRSSGNPIFDRAAMYLVVHLGRVGAIPSADRRINQVTLKLSYGDGAKTVSDAIHVARSDREEQLANERRDRNLIGKATRVANNR